MQNVMILSIRIGERFLRDYGKYFECYNVPETIKQIAINIMRRFTIFGICDGMYLCNAIASEAGIGDGNGHFHSEIEIKNSEEIAEKIQFAYASNIKRSEIEELASIISSEELDIQKTILSIEAYIKGCKMEEKTCEECRKEYLDHCITEAEITLKELKGENYE